MPTILVADDDPCARVLLCDILRPQGYCVHEAEDGISAAETFQRLQPDVVLLDVRMPMAGGIEVCRLIKENPATCLTPVVLVTANGSRADRLLGIEAGADDFLTKPVDPLELMARVRSLARLKAHTDELERAETVLFSLAASIEERDPSTSGHCARLSSYAAALGKRLGLPSEEIVALTRGGLVHDIGKLGVPDAILLKREELDDEEKQVMRQHPVVGERICAPLKSMRLVLPIIRHHHERWDGSGYPDGLRGESIPLTARVLQVVDIFDALTMDRPYRAAVPREAALAAMRLEAASECLDRRVLEAFIGLLHDNEDGG